MGLKPAYIYGTIGSVLRYNSFTPKNEIIAGISNCPPSCNSHNFDIIQSLRRRISRVADVPPSFNQPIVWDSTRENFKGRKKSNSPSIITMKNSMFDSFVMVFT